jgi:hypothetical protein
MNRLARELTRSQKHLERAVGRPTFTWNGGSFECVANAAAAGKNLGPGGLSPEADLVLFVRADLFPAEGQPQPAERLDYEARKYRIETISTLPGRGLLRLTCVDASRRI